MLIARLIVFALLVAVAPLSARADDVLFFGNSFTSGGACPVVEDNGGVAMLFEKIAEAKGKHVSTMAVTKGGQPWSYHLAQPATETALNSKPWTWIVLQDYSTRPTRIDNVKQFMQDGEIFSDRIAKASPHAGILLYETWARPPGAFFKTAPGSGLSGPEQMMSDLHDSYGRLRDDLAAKDPNRPVRVALVGTAFARVTAKYPSINVNATDMHHASAEGYYLAALVIYETIYGGSVVGAPIQFYNGALKIPSGDAAKLQKVADEVAGGAAK